MLKIIENNPFRILGVYSNAKRAEIVSNCDDMEAYLSIGQTVSFNLDYNNILPSVNRTTQTVQNAKQQINLPKEKLKHALFWFFKDSSSEHAMTHLKHGDFDSTNSVFEIEDSFSTLINQSVVALMQNNIGTAIARVTEMIHDNDNRIAFVNAICGITFSINESDLAHLYIDTLLEEIPVSELMDSFQENGVSGDDDNYIKEKAVNELTSRINTEISKARSVARDDADANYKAGKVLIEKTKNDLSMVKNMLGDSDINYQMLADDLAKTILQCGINYFNNTDDDDDIEKALAIQEYASKVAVGKLCKDRCGQNVAILKKEKEALPPVMVKTHDSAIKTAIQNQIILGGQTIDNAIAMMKECAPHIVAIKEHTELRTYYLNISTQVVNVALSSVIKEYNDTLERYDGNSSSSVFSVIKEMLKKAWKATLMMDKFDIEESFKNGRYSENRKLLYEIVKSSGVYYTIPLNINNDELDLRTEEEFWDDCCTSADYKDYLNRYPNAKHKIDARCRYNELFAEEEAKRKEKEEKERQARLEREAEDREFKACTSKRDYKNYLKRYPNGNYKWEAEKKIEEFKDKNSRTGCIVAIIALILVGGIIGAIADNSGKGFLIGCGIAVAILVWGFLNALI